MVGSALVQDKVCPSRESRDWGRTVVRYCTYSHLGTNLAGLSSQLGSCPADDYIPYKRDAERIMSQELGSRDVVEQMAPA